MKHDVLFVPSFINNHCITRSDKLAFNLTLAFNYNSCFLMFGIYMLKMEKVNYLETGSSIKNNIIQESTFVFLFYRRFSKPIQINNFVLDCHNSQSRLPKCSELPEIVRTLIRL